MNAMVLSLIAALTLSSAVFAQPPGGGGGRGGPGGGFGGGRGGGMQLYEKLGLNETQKTKIKALSDKQREEMTAIRKKYTDQIVALLTPEQKKKLEEARKQSRGGFGGPGGPPGGGAPGGGKPGGPGKK